MHAQIIFAGDAANMMRRENYREDFFFAVSVGTRLPAGFLMRGTDARPFDKTFCHAMVSALCSVVASAAARMTLVLPLLPQPPGTGRKIVGSASTSTACCSGVSFTMPH